MSYTSIAAILSLDVTRALVAAGLGLGFDGARYTSVGSPAPLAIVGATATTPIVVTTAQPHAFATLASTSCIGGVSCIITGVGGNLAANNVSTNALDRTVGQPQGIHAVPIDDTHFALYGQDQTTGALVPLAGSGVYTSGGTVALGLTDGGVLLGSEYLAAYTAPPRIVLVPRSFTFGPRSNAVPGAYRTADIKQQRQQRSIRTERCTFEARVWGQAAAPHVGLDFDATHAIMAWLVDSAHLLAAGTVDDGAGTWLDQAATATQRLKAGHELSFALTLSVPITDAPLPSATGITVDATGNLQINGGTPELACQGTIS